MDKQLPNAPVGAVHSNQSAPASENTIIHWNGNGNSFPDPASRYEGQETADENLNLRELWRKVRRRKWMIMCMVLLATLTVAVEVFRSKSIYQATTTVEIGKDNQMMIKTGDLIIQSDDSDLQT